MPYAEVGELRLWYEFTGPEAKPLILQFGGSLFGRANFDPVNDGFREHGFRLLSYDAQRLWPLRPAARGVLGRGLGRRGRRPAGRARHRAGAHPRDVDGRDGGDRLHREVPRADDRLVRGLRHGALRRPPADALPQLAPVQSEALPIDDFSDLLTIQAVSADFVEEHPEIFANVRARSSRTRPSPSATRASRWRRWTSSRSSTGSTTDPVDERHQGHHDAVAAGALRLQRRPDRRARARLGRASEFADIGHAPLLERPGEALEVVTASSAGRATAPADRGGGRRSVPSEEGRHGSACSSVESKIVEWLQPRMTYLSPFARLSAIQPWPAPPGPWSQGVITSSSPPMTRAGAAILRPTYRGCPWRSSTRRPGS